VKFAARSILVSVMHMVPHSICIQLEPSSLRKSGTLWTKNTHRYGDGENQFRYEDCQVTVAGLRNVVLTNDVQPVIRLSYSRSEYVYYK